MPRPSCGALLVRLTALCRAPQQALLVHFHALCRAPHLRPMLPCSSLPPQLRALRGVGLVWACTRLHALAWACIGAAAYHAGCALPQAQVAACVGMQLSRLCCCCSFRYCPLPQFFRLPYLKEQAPQAVQVRLEASCTPSQREPHRCLLLHLALHSLQEQAPQAAHTRLEQSHTHTQHAPRCCPLPRRTLAGLEEEAQAAREVWHPRRLGAAL